LRYLPVGPNDPQIAQIMFVLWASQIPCSGLPKLFLKPSGLPFSIGTRSCLGVRLLIGYPKQQTAYGKMAWSHNYSNLICACRIGDLFPSLFAKLKAKL
jgi:hypothetical protein